MKCGSHSACLAYITYNLKIISPSTALTSNTLVRLKAGKTVWMLQRIEGLDIADPECQIFACLMSAYLKKAKFKYFPFRFGKEETSRLFKWDSEFVVYVESHAIFISN